MTSRKLTHDSRPVRAFALPIFAALMLAASAMTTAFGCGLSTGGLPPDGSGGSGGAPSTCSNAEQCDDDNACTDDKCSSEGLCEHTAVAEGPAPASEQTVGDCKTVKCVAGKPTEEDDDGDKPDDDSECTTDTCVEGEPFNTAVTQGTTCHDANGDAGSCDLQGVCFVECVPGEKPCMDPGPCNSVACDASNGQCVKTPLPDGAPVNGDMPGDCHAPICKDGAPLDKIDDSDVPASATDCDLEVCNMGVPSNPAKTPDLDVGCSTAAPGNATGFCNGTACVQCNLDAQCFGTSPDDDCQHPVCNQTTHTCEPEFEITGTPAGQANQIAFDCHIVVCDGAGGKLTMVDDSDLPNDNNDCTTDVCTNGVEANNNKAMGTACGSVACGNPLVCNNMGQCAGCTADCQCQPPNYNTCSGGGMANVCGCTPKTCVQQNPVKTCGAQTDLCGTPINCDNGTQNGTETDIDCGGSAATCPTRCAVGKKCGVTGDCVAGATCVEGVCCSTTCTGLCQSCLASKKGAGSDGVCGPIAVGTDPDGECSMDAATTCNQTGFCDGSNACQKYSLGIQCATQVCSNGVQTATKQCNGTGTCNQGGAQVNCAPYVCNSGGTACLTMCSTNADCNSSNYCSGGMCVAKKGNGVACGVGFECTSSNCVDGVCCNSSCGNTCQACTNAKTGAANGTCSNVTSGTDPDNECPGTTNCMGGSCALLSNGTACTLNGECSSGNCVDGVCCNTTCTGTCKACNVAGLGGTCSNVLSGQTDSTCMGAGQACNGGGSCLKVDGQGCGANSECVNAHCVDGVCCNTTCTGTCQACSAAKTGGANGTCANVTAGSDPDNECAGTTNCSAGACVLLGNGTSCTLNGECTSGNCVDGVCCNTTCTGTCKACNVAGLGGTCSDVLSGQTDSTCNGAGQACNGGGACLKVDGQACGADNQCVNNHCADSVCCNTACNGVCQACAAAKTGGANGTCANVTAATDPDAECPGVTNCSAGACALLGNGTACTLDGECTSTHCADGVCCDMACGGCMACTAALKVSGVGTGTCGDAINGTDPHGSCAFAAQSTCGNDGECDGSGACRKWQPGTVCGGTCAADTISSAMICDGAGNCDAYIGPFVCDGTPATCTATGCSDTCADDSGCVAGYFCNTSNGTCTPEFAAGQTCTSNNQCVNNCASGTCN